MCVCVCVCVVGWVCPLCLVFLFALALVTTYGSALTQVRFIAPIWPWNAPKFKSIDWRTQPPPRRIPGNTKHDQGKLFKLPPTWNESTDKCWDETQKPPRAFPYWRHNSNTFGLAGGDFGSSSTGEVVMSGRATRLRTGNSRPPTHGSSRPSTNRSVSQLGQSPASNRSTGKSRDEGKVDPLRLNIPASQLLGRQGLNSSRPATNASGRLSVRPNESARQIVKEALTA